MFMRLVDHLKSRGMDPTLYRYFKCYSTNKITFLLYNLSGQIVGFQHYRPLNPNKGMKNNPKLGRYYTYLPRGITGVFGLELLDRAKGPIFIVEGVFKAAALHRLGYNALAVLTANPKPLGSFIRALRGSWEVYAIGDGDKAGGELVQIVGAGVCSLIDVDEMDDTEVRTLVRRVSND